MTAWRVSAGGIAEAAQRLPLAELAVVAAAAGVAWLGNTHLAALPAWAPWDFCWTDFLACGFALLWFLRGLYRCGPVLRISPWRIAGFLLGLAGIYAVLLTHFELLAQHMFFLNRIQHAVLHHLAPFLIALSWPGATIARGLPSFARRLCQSAFVRRLLHLLRQPLIAVLLFEGLLFFWLLPPITFRAMLDWRLYEVMNASMVLDGLLFWFVVLDPRPAPVASIGFVPRAAMAFLVMFPQIAVGTAIGMAQHDLYPSFALCGRVYPSIGPLLDQEIGALILWVPTGMMSAIATVVIMWRLFRYEDAVGRVAHPARA